MNSASAATLRPAQLVSDGDTCPAALDRRWRAIPGALLAKRDSSWRARPPGATQSARLASSAAGHL